MFQRTQAQCLGHLVSIIKIFVQAAILVDDDKNLLRLIASTSTSPFRKTVVQDPALESDNNSSVNTPKFANSFVSNPGQESQEPPSETKQTMNLNSLVDDFQKLIEQMRQKSIGKDLLEKVIDFSCLIKKLLQVTLTAVCISKHDEPLTLLVQNCLDLLMPCIL